MARRRKSESLLEVLFTAPWWISFVIGLVILIGLKWIAPAMWGSSPILKPLVSTLSGFAWLFAGAFFFVGSLSFAREMFEDYRAAKAGKSSAAWNPRVIQGRREPRVSGFPNVDQPIPSQWSPPAAARIPPTEWSLALLQDLEWKRFEDVCQKFYQTKGIRSETTNLGADGGIDIRLYQDESGKPTSIAQCKAWNSLVGVKPVRELLGVMTHEKIAKGFFMASGEFSDDAKTFAETNPITLISGAMLVSMIQRLPEADQQALLAFATEGDYHTPTCPSCGIKMRRVAGTGGRAAFWGCPSYPRCRQQIGMRAADRS
jgi:restriction system protein